MLKINAAPFSFPIPVARWLQTRWTAVFRRSFFQHFIQRLNLIFRGWRLGFGVDLWFFSIHGARKHSQQVLRRQ